MDFALAPEIDHTRLAIRDFVQSRLIPLEADPASYDEHENITEALLETPARRSQIPRPVGAQHAHRTRRPWLQARRHRALL